MKLDIKKLVVKSSELLEAVIISKHKYSYEQIDEQIEKNSLPVSLDLLYKLTAKIRKQRLLSGYDFRTNEYRLVLNEKEELVKVNEEQGSPSHKLVEECMLLANCEAAKKLSNNGIYRVHEEPSRKKLEELLKKVEMLGIKAKLKEDVHSTIVSIQGKAAHVDLVEQVDKLIIQSQQQAAYSSKVSEHFGLGFSNYSHFTSPIRRYSDLVLHRMLKNKNIPKDIDDVCENISNKERSIAKLVWDLEDRKYARWASENINNEYQALIVEVENEPKGELVNEAIGLRFIIENYESQQLFSKINVKIISADIISKKIIVKIV
jgi:ribonuclease R